MSLKKENKRQTASTMSDMYVVNKMTSQYGQGGHTEKYQYYLTT